jgi:hypothetical protein
MVNNPMHGHPNPFVNARHELPWPPPSSEPGFEATREIPFKVWDLRDIHAIAQKFLDGDSNLLRAVTSDCITDMQEEMLSLEDVATLLRSVTEHDYLNSRWCMTSARPGVTARPELRWLPCDAYEVRREIFKSGVAYKKKYYVKVCRAINGSMLLIVSMHLSKFG